MERNDRLIRKKIYKYMLTGVMTTVALQLGNVVDAMIVGNLIGSIGNSAVTAGIPFVYILQAAAILMGTGGAVTIAVLLGKREVQKAGKVMGFSVIFCIAYPMIFMIATPFSVPAFISLTGAEGQLADMIRSITTVYSLGMPAVSFVLCMAYLITVDNHPGLAAKMNIVANVVNLGLDYILVKYTSLGITGAALSTVLGYVAAGLIFIPGYFRSRERMVKPVFRGSVREGKLIRLTMKNGLPNIVSLVMTVVSMFIINSAVLRALGAGHFSAYAVANNTQNIVSMFLGGMASVIASVAGVLYGEKDYFGMRAVYRRVLKSAMIAGGIVMAIFLLVPGFLAKLYGFDQPDILPDLETGIRIFAFSFVFYILNAILQSYYRTIGQTFLSTTNIALQMILFRIPFMLLGMHFFGFEGIFGAVILSELTAYLVTNLLRIIMQKMGKTPQKGMLAIPDTNGNVILDLTVKGNDREAVNVARQIKEACEKEPITPERANRLGVAAEEVVSNIGKYGYKDGEEKDVDVCLSHVEDRYILRFRDDGIPFNPMEYDFGEQGEYDVHGLELLKKMAEKIQYMRVISLNNTVVEINANEVSADEGSQVSS